MRRSVCAELKVTLDKLSQFRRKPRKNSRKFQKIAKRFRKNGFAFFSKLCFSNAHPRRFAFNYVFSKIFFYHSIEQAKTQGMTFFDFFKSSSISRKISHKEKSFKKCQKTACKFCRRRF